MLISRRNFLCASFVVGTVPLTPLAGQPQLRRVTPEMFGAKGDGISNDSAAFAALSDHINSVGGGEVVLRRATYIVGGHSQPLEVEPINSFVPARVMEFVGCSAPLIIRGNGATIRCAAGLLFGTFNPSTGEPTQHPQPFYGRGEVTSPYLWMIKVEGCTGPVVIENIELDGNLPQLRIGGPWGDTGHQYPGIGLALVDNTASETIIDVHSHHHALDGLMVDGVDRQRAARSTVTSVTCDYNGRQGCSMVGGRGYDFVNCAFNNTGKGPLSSAPGAGVDIEAERNKKVRDLLFHGCTFSNNSGCGIVADQGDAADVRFVDCTAIGSSGWAAWPRKPRFRFDRCTFVGPIVNCFGDPTEPELATQFHSCVFLDDPSLSPIGAVYVGQNEAGPIADLFHSPNVLFSGCDFRLTHRAALPWTTHVVKFSNCRMSQQAPQTAYPRGTYVGRNTIRGNVDLNYAVVLGELIVNGVLIPRTQS